MYLGKIKVKLIAHTPNPDEVVAKAGKLCYSKVGVEGISEKLTDENINRFVNMLADIGHESPLEHCSFTFAIEGISRACSHQIVRHRLASYSQQSQRYVNLDKTFDFIVPSIIEDMDKHYGAMYVGEFENDMKAIHNMYKKWQENIKDFVEITNYPTYGMTAEKVANENARAVLPNACETKIVVTMNGRSLLNFFAHRDCNRAQGEIRDLARLMIAEVQKVAPALFKKAGASCRSGKCHEGNMCCKKPLPKWEV